MEVVKKLAAQRLEAAKQLRAAQRVAAIEESAIEKPARDSDNKDFDEYGKLSKLLLAFSEGDKDDSGDLPRHCLTAEPLRLASDVLGR